MEQNFADFYCLGFKTIDKDHSNALPIPSPNKYTDNTILQGHYPKIFMIDWVTIIDISKHYQARPNYSISIMGKSCKQYR